MTGDIRTELVAIDAGDGVMLNGAAWLPRTKSSDTAIALAPGTGSEFYQPLFSFLGPGLAAAGYPTLALNRRDHGAWFGYVDLAAGSMDHRFAVDFLAARGARRVVLGGHSFGTVTAPYYVAETDDTRVSGLLLYAPLGDLRPASAVICGGIKAYDRYVAEARRMVAEGNGDDAFVIPPMVPGGMPLTQSFRVFLDKRGPETKAVPVELIRHMGERPLLGIRDPADPYPATQPPARELLEAANPNLSYVLLDDIRDGETDAEAHYLAGQDAKVLDITLQWLERNGFTP